MSLKEVFEAYCKLGHTHGGAGEMAIDNSQFAKLCKDVTIINKKCTSTDVDICFSKAKKAARRLNFAAFKRCLGYLAPVRFPSKSEAEAYDAIERLVTDHGGPELHGTKAEKVRHYDEMDKMASERDLKMKQRERRRSRTGVVDAYEVAKEHEAHTRDSGDAEEGTLRWQFQAFANLGRTHASGSAEMDNVQFVKYLKDTGVIKKRGKFTTTDADLTFAMAVTHGSRRIGFDQFQNALLSIAKALYPGESEATAYAALTAKVLEHGAPTLNATQADNVRLNKTDIGHVDEKRVRRRSKTHVVDPYAVRAEQSAHAREASKEAEEGTLKWQFQAFANLGRTHASGAAEMDSAQFAKYCRDTGVVKARGKVTGTDVDLAFTRVLTRGARRIGYSQFRKALQELASLKYPSKSAESAFDMLEAVVLEAGAPTLNATEADDVRLNKTDIGHVDEKRVRRRSKTHTVDPYEVRKDQERHMREAGGEASEGSLKWQFQQFAGLGRTHASGAAEMDSAQFAKYCKDVGIAKARGKVTTTEVDLAFTRNLVRGSRRIGYHQFQDALQELSALLYPDMSESEAFERIVGKALDGGAPLLRATQADDVRLNKEDIGHVDEKRVERRSKTHTVDPYEVRKDQERHKAEAEGDVVEGSMRWQFQQFAGLGRTHASGAAEMDSAQFAKYCKDVGISATTGKVTTTEVDLAFTKVLVRGSRRIGFHQFIEALAMLAEQKYPDLTPEAAYDRLEAKAMDRGAPLLHATKADDVRLNKEDIGHVDERRERRRSRTGVADPTAVRHEHEAAMDPRELEADEGTLKYQFLAWANHGHTHGSKSAEMDNVQYIKCLKDTDLIGGKFGTTQADLIWAQIITRGARRIRFAQFCEALQKASAIIYPGEPEDAAYSKVERRVIDADGPVLHATKADDVRLNKEDIGHVKERRSHWETDD